MTTRTAYPDVANKNPRSKNKYRMLINKFPELEYMIQGGSIPQVTGAAISVDTPFTDFKVAGDNLEYEPLTIEFVVDEELLNYGSVLTWMEGIYFPETHTQYAEHIKVQDGVDCKIVIQMLSSAYNPILNFEFLDCIPTTLSELPLGEGSDGADYIKATVTFEYSLFKINRNV